MTNYQEVFNKLYSDFFDGVAVDKKEAIRGLFEQELRWYLGIDAWEYTTKYLTEKYDICKILDDMQRMIEWNHAYIHRTKIPWDIVDMRYKKALRRVYEDEGKLDFNKAAGYFYEAITA